MTALPNDSLYLRIQLARRCIRVNEPYTLRLECIADMYVLKAGTTAVIFFIHFILFRGATSCSDPVYNECSNGENAKIILPEKLMSI